MTKNIMTMVTDQTARGRRLEPGERRAQLLHHAVSAFADAGIERAVHADVANRANVSTPTVFKYFPTREALVDAVLSEIEETFENLRSLLPKDVVLTSSELARALAGVLSELCVTRPNLMKVALTWSVAFSPVRARYMAFEGRLLNNLSSVIGSQTIDNSDTRILFAGSLLFIRMHFDDSTAETRRDYISRLCEIFKTAPTTPD